MTSAIMGNGSYVRASSVAASFPSSAIRKLSAEDDPQFAAMVEVVRAAEKGPDLASREQSRAVQAHTVVRQGGQIVASIGRDGQVMTSNAIGARLDWTSIEQRASGMTPADRRDLIAGELKKAAGTGAVVESYGESGTAPTRGALEDEMSRFAQAARRAAGLW